LFLGLAPVRILRVIDRLDLPRYAIYVAAVGVAIGVFAGPLPGWMIIGPVAVAVFAIGDVRVPRVGGSRKEIDPGKAYPEAVTAYPNRSIGLLFGSLGSLFLCAILVLWLAAIADRGHLQPSDAVLLVVAGVAAVLVAVLVREVRIVRSRVPLCRLDVDGLESAAGRIRWRDVTEVGISRYAYDNGEENGSYLRLALRPGATFEPVSSSYFQDPTIRYDSAVRSEGELEVEFWDRHAGVLEMVGRFYSGPISQTPDERSWRVRAERAHS
jgi:hypothetical protein